MKDKAKCKICDCEAGHERFKIKEMMFGTCEKFAYFKCGNCGCLQIEVFPKDMDKYYPENYYSFADFTASFLKNMLARYFITCRDSYAVFRKGTLGSILWKMDPNMSLGIFSNTEINKNSRILDIGCGSGKLLTSLRRIGFTRLTGMDPHMEKSIRVTGLDLLKKTIFEAQGEYDLILFHHSLEHMAEPGKVLSAARELLAPGGICMVAVPLADSWAAKHYGVNWVQIDAPRHFFIYSRKSLEILAGKTGFQIGEIIFDSTELQFIGSEQYKNGISLKAEKSYYVDPAKSDFTRKEVRTLARKAKELNEEGLGDQAVFYLKKSKTYNE